MGRANMHMRKILGNSGLPQWDYTLDVEWVRALSSVFEGAAHRRALEKLAGLERTAKGAIGAKLGTASETTRNVLHCQWLDKAARNEISGERREVDHSKHG